MKLFIICSKRFYDRIPEINQTLKNLGHETVLPNCYEDPGTEERMKSEGDAEHARWKASMLRHSGDVISTVDGVLVLNFDKDGDESYIGGATFLEMYEAFLQNKKIFLYNCIPSSILSDEIRGFAPVILHQELKRINW